MAETISNNKRIAKNTAFLYIRMVFVTLVTLYTARIVLQALGVVDYGIYNVVGGVVSLLTVLNSSMGAATQRYISFDLGQGNDEQLKKDFAACLNIYLLLAVVVIILSETIGLWLVNTQLTIPSERMAAANAVYQCSIFICVFALLQNPFNAAIIAHERMGAFAWISILEVMLKLGLAFIILYVSYDHLIIYGVLTLFSYICITFTYVFYGIISFKECRFKVFYEKKIYKDLTAYSGWNLFGTSAGLLSNQGVNILLNVFFGPIVNTSRAIAMQVSGAITQFFANFYIAIKPQVIKYYAEDRLQDMHKLILNSARYAYYLALIVSMPIFIELPFIIKLWLGQTPDYLIIFTRLTIIGCLIDSLSNPLMTAALASSNIRNYQIVVAFVNAMTLPLSYVCLFFTVNAVTVFIVALFISVCALYARAYFVQKLVGLSISTFNVKVLGRVIPITLFSPLIPILPILYLNDGVVRLCSVFLTSVIFTGIIIFILGIDKGERTILVNVLRKYAMRS